MLQRFVKKIVPGIVMGCTALVLSGCVDRPLNRLGLSAGDEIPAFYLKDAVSGKSVGSDDLKGKPYVISIFGTWCPPCRMELNEFQKKLWEPLQDSGIGVYGINFGDEDEATIKDFAKANGITFPLLVDVEASFRHQAGVSAVPQSYVVGKDGRILETHEGFSSESVDAIKSELLKAK